MKNLIEKANRDDFEEGSLGDRMKFYESSSRIFLDPKIGDSLIMRFDGRSFSSFTHSYIKPYDESITDCMLQATLAVSEEIPNAIFAYTQSDEITVICKPKTHDEEEIPFKGNVQKLCSVYASTVSTVFNLTMQKCRQEDVYNQKYYRGGIPKLAQFDARVWLLHKEELINCLIWRQQDCERNSVSMVAQNLYSHKMLQNKNKEKMLEMILEAGQDWNEMPINLQRGTFFYKEKYEKETLNNQKVTRNRWTFDQNMPMLSKDKNYFYQKFENILI